MSSVPLTAVPRTQTLCEAVEALPEGVTGEVIRGQLYAFPRPSARHGRAASSIGGDLFNPFDRGRGGPGGWWIIGEPEVHFARDVEFCVPDIGGWRRERMPSLPDDHRFELVPDWVCEIASPSTASHDREVKMPLYASQGVAHAWLVDTRARRLEAYELRDGVWQDIGVFEGDAPIRVAPFDAIEIAPPWE